MNGLQNDMAKNGLLVIRDFYEDSKFWRKLQIWEEYLKGLNKILNELTNKATLKITEFSKKANFLPIVMLRHPFYMFGYISNKTKLSTLRYRTAYNQILGHAKAYQTYKENFYEKQGGNIMLALSSGWAVPKTDSIQDMAAADRYMQFHLGIFAHPIFVNGDYPDVVKSIVGNRREAAGIASRLPSFTQEEKIMIKGSYDLFGLNHYSTDKVADRPSGDEQSFNADEAFTKSGDPAWPDWVNGHVAPFGFRKLLKYIKDNYNDPTVIVTENGVSPPTEASKTGEKRLDDAFRVHYHKR